MRRHENRRWRTGRSAAASWVATLIAALLTAQLLGVTPGCRRRSRVAQPPGPAKKLPVQRLQPAAPGSFAKVAARLAPSVVHLSSATQVRGGPADWFPTGTPSTGPNIGGHPEALRRCLGTGFIIDAKGVALTNAHVVSRSEQVFVHLHGGARVKAKVAGQDARTDIALLRFSPPAGVKLKPLRMGDSDRLEVGEWVVALGNPFGMGLTIAAGLVSAKARHDLPAGQEGFWGMIQTDVAINPGNSGGPLVTVQGEVVGISTAVDQTASGIGFAVPINLAHKLMPMLSRDGKVVRTWVGIYMEKVTAATAKAASYKGEGGAMIKSVYPGGPADRAGLRAGDIITAFDSKAVKSARELPILASLAGVNRLVPIKVWRKGKLYSFSIKTERMPQ